MAHPSKNAASARKPGIVHPFWLLKAIGAVILLASLCTYLTLCLLYRAEQWQLVLHPVHQDSNPPAGLVRFGPDGSGLPQLTGVWLPSSPSAHYASFTVLFLPGGDGSMSDHDATLRALQSFGLNVFAFDYRGYGFSASVHPSEEKMQEDAAAAWSYLTDTRNVPPTRILLYGVGLGASLATRLAEAHPEAPALILEQPRGDLLTSAQADPRFRLIPVKLLFDQQFSLTTPLSTLVTPKLILHLPGDNLEMYRDAATPKITVSLQSSAGPLYQQAIDRFLDQYLPAGQPRP